MDTDTVQLTMYGETVVYEGGLFDNETKRYTDDKWSVVHADGKVVALTQTEVGTIIKLIRALGLATYGSLP